jgi:hypothetical protein
VIFGRKRRSAIVEDVEVTTEDSPDVDTVDTVDAEDAEDAADEVEIAEIDDQDWREDGPFDFDEVDLGEEVARIDLETLIITPWDGLNLQLQVDEASRRVLAVTGVWAESGLEIALFAAPAAGGLAQDLRTEAVAEAEEAGGTIEASVGVFGPELHRVLPQAGPQGEKLFHVSRIWFAEGPRWLLRGTLLGEAALDTADEAKMAPFVEFFRNLVVRRGSQPMVPGERMTMRLPEGAS